MAGQREEGADLQEVILDENGEWRVVPPGKDIGELVKQASEARTAVVASIRQEAKTQGGAVVSKVASRARGMSSKAKEEHQNVQAALHELEQEDQAREDALLGRAMPPPPAPAHPKSRAKAVARGIHASKQQAQHFLDENPEVEEIGELSKSAMAEAVREGKAVWDLRKAENRENVDMRTAMVRALTQASSYGQTMLAVHQAVNHHMAHLKNEIRKAVASEVSASLFQLDRELHSKSSEGELGSSLGYLVAPIKMQWLHATNMPMIYLSPIVMAAVLVCLVLDWDKECDVDYVLFFTAYLVVEMLVFLVRLRIHAKSVAFHAKYERELKGVTVDVEALDSYPKPDNFPHDSFVIVIEKANNVPAMDTVLLGGGRSDPFVVIDIPPSAQPESAQPSTHRSLRDQASRIKATVLGNAAGFAMTSVKWGVLNPVWAEGFDLGNALQPHHTVTFTMYDKDRASKDDLIGSREITVKELLTKKTHLLTLVDEKGNEVVGERKTRKTVLRVALLKVPSRMTMPAPNTRPDAGLVGYEDLVEMGKEALEVHNHITGSVAYKLSRVAVPFSALWRTYGVYLVVNSVCDACDAQNLAVLNQVLAVGYLILFLYLWLGVLVWLLDLLFGNKVKAAIIGQAESFDRQHGGVPVWTMMASQLFNDDTSNMAVFMRLKLMRDIDLGRAKKKQLLQKIWHVDKELKEARAL